MSRPPLPLHVHQLQGTYRKDRHQPRPRLACAAPRAPAWLSAPAKAKWKDVARQLAAAGVLTGLDLDALAAYCEAFATWRAAAATVAAEGPTYKADNGLVKRHPAVAIMQQAGRDLHSWGDKLGLTPAARQRLRIEPPPEGDELDELFNGAPDQDGPDKSRFFRIPARVRA
jgi:P27 family predicted phage terminase small subunit